MAQVNEGMIRAYAVLTDGEWHTATETAALSGIAGRTARDACKALVALGVLTHFRASPSAGGFRYRLAENFDALEVTKELELGVEVLGIEQENDS
jgi:hypothetical protein